MADHLFLKFIIDGYWLALQVVILPLFLIVYNNYLNWQETSPLFDKIKVINSLSKRPAVTRDSFIRTGI
jgi:hypothetical protein